jgi:hypothetical protein
VDRSARRSGRGSLISVPSSADGDDGLQQGIDPVADRQYRLEPGLQLGEQLIEPELGQDRAGL